MKVPFVDLRAQNVQMAEAIFARHRQLELDSRFIMGKTVQEFEGKFAEYLGAKYCVCVNSGTSALHLALKASRIESGDEVIVPALSWVATAFAVNYCGATPVFVDIEPSTYCMDPNKLKEKLTERTKAILPVHFYGQCASIGILRNFAENRKILLLEDCAQAHGAELCGKYCGTFGAAGCFSFYPTKPLGAWGEGGAVVTDDHELVVKLRILRDSGQLTRHVHTDVGYNYRMEEFQAAVLLEKLEHLDAWNEERRRVANRYWELLHDTDGLTLPMEVHSHVHHLFVVLVENRDEFRRKLAEKGVETAIHYPTAIPQQPCYGLSGGLFPVAERVAATCVSLPCYAEMTDGQIEYVARSVKECLK